MIIDYIERYTNLLRVQKSRHSEKIDAIGEGHGTVILAGPCCIAAGQPLAGLKSSCQGGQRAQIALPKAHSDVLNCRWTSSIRDARTPLRDKRPG